MLSFIGCALAILLALNLAPFIAPPPKMDYKEGDLVEKDIRSPVSIPMPKDSAKFAAEQDSAAATVLPVLRVSNEAELKWRKTLRNMPSSPSIAKELGIENRDLISSKLLAGADSVLARIRSQGYARQKEDIHTRTVVVIADEFELEESVNNILGFWDVDTLIENEAKRLFPYDRPRAALLTDLLRKIVLPNPNLVLDKEEFKARQEKARARVDTKEGYIERGELLAEANSRIDAYTLKKINAINAAVEANLRVRFQIFAQQNILYFLILFALAISIYLLRLRLGPRKMLFIAFIMVVGIILNFVFRKFSIWWFLPTAFIALSAAVFLEPIYGILLASATSLLLYLPIQTEPEFLIYAVAVGFGALAAYPFIKKQTGFIAVLGFVILGGLLARSSYLLSSSSLSAKQLPLWLAGIGINGALNTILFMATFFVAERVFGFSSKLTLNLLANLNRPLFKEFALKAAGSYHHSIVVGNLSEKAALAISADSALALAGGYYHDIGKMTKPHYYIENQLEQENPHDSLKPRMSALILASHVKEGDILAKRNRLPKPIRDIILQHHGTTRMEFFYQKSIKQKSDDPVPESAFRYPGPKPQTKEAAIVMLADSVEAAVRSKGFSDRENLAEIIKNVIEHKIADGQLDECAFTTSDIHKVQTVFAATLMGIFHPRVRYEQTNNNRTNNKNTGKKTSHSKVGKKNS